MHCRAKGEASPPVGRYSGQLWQAHVLANLPFYSRLLPLLLNRLRARASSRCDESLEDLRRARALFSPLSPGLLGRQHGLHAKQQPVPRHRRTACPSASLCGH
jgi:hypothetical protein